MKYIDADKLIADIERFSATEYGSNTFGDDVANGALDYVLEEIIPSLQQEQPFPRWIHANYSDKPEIRQSPSGGPYLQSGHYMIWLSDLETLPKNGTDLTNPVQEQPEVDLEEYIENEIKHYGLSLYEASYGTFSASEIDRIMRKFYELGLKARKV